MPIVEVLYTSPAPLNVANRKAFVREVAQVFNEVLGTPQARLQFAIRHLQPDEGTDLLTLPDDDVIRGSTDQNSTAGG
jgi:phenylpyruvate tautomerase PptA (4-oxalocrotonate tautomerase family)